MLACPLQQRLSELLLIDDLSGHGISVVSVRASPFGRATPFPIALLTAPVELVYAGPAWDGAGRAERQSDSMPLEFIH
ncbi:hypothetical protein QFZ23_004358 [Arthrobacter globiformis]|nr:hypothetical protein [Arthrobacter globiformis]